MNTFIDANISYILENNLLAYRQLMLNCGAKPEFFPRHSILSSSGAPITKLYFLLEGIVKIYTNNVHGYIRILGYHKKNTIFAMDGLIGVSPAVVTTESVTPIRVVPIGEQELRWVNMQNNEFFWDLSKYYCTVLRLMCFDAENQSISEGKVRLANFLNLYTSAQSVDNKGIIKMTQDDLASAVNCSRVQIARICADLRKQGIIDTKRGQILIKDFPALAKLMQIEQ